MKKTLAAVVLAGLAVVGFASPALAAETPQNNGVVVVDEPDTTDLENIWTFAPLGVPVLGLIQSVNGVPGKLLPSF
ncbi:hypothetical protein [Amycolatopsis sp.]|jgi:hypothetical protein|uniref:hypothetical protein n=1 Tax=Amycolatopsis sp. TaxID=37632 RepID=UPI002E044122|nr:hypothetical protein [Amycolatopsis sp.]